MGKIVCVFSEVEKGNLNFGPPRDEEDLKVKIHSIGSLTSVRLSHLLSCMDCRIFLNRTLLTFASHEFYRRVITPRALGVLASRRKLLEEQRDDEIYLVAIVVPDKGTYFYHDTTLAFISPLPVHQAEHTFSKSMNGTKISAFSQIGSWPGTDLSLRSSQGHYKDHGKRTTIDLFAKKPQ